ncbi:ATP-binding cassette sub-family C member 2-like [Ctenodactylus gundi]
MASSSYQQVSRGHNAQKCSPEESASFFNKVTFSWFSRIIILGYRKPLEREDLFELNESDSPYVVCPVFEKQWRKEVLRNNKREKATFHKGSHIQKPSLLYALWSTFKLVLIEVAFFKVFADVLSFTSPLIMKQMIIFCDHSSGFGWSGYGYAVALFVVILLQTLILQQYQRFNMLTSAKVRTAVTGLIYKKALLISNVSRKMFSTGEIINLMSADAQQLMDMTGNLHLLWSAPFQILMAIALLWQELGPAVLAGVAVLVLVIPITASVAIRVKKLKKDQTMNKDKQIKLLKEILHGIKIIKLYAWEPAYKNKIIKIRDQELEFQKSAGYLAVFSKLTLTSIPFLVSLATFGVYFSLEEGNILTATKVFTSVSLFNILRISLFELPMVVSSVMQGSVAYVSQQAWIQNCILQENILFGSVMQRQHYERILEACALLPDLEQLPNGDQTEIGERGLNISGGQKHRVSLARAVYSDADIYLLDDPLSAVDVHVGKQLFDKVIGPSGLLNTKTRILVTHNQTLLPQMDLILVMKDGRIAQMGTYQELLDQIKNLTDFFQVKNEQQEGHASQQVRVMNSTPSPEDQIVEQKDRPLLDPRKQFSIKMENIPVGGMKFSIILKYLQAFGWCWVCLSVATYLGQNLVSIGQNLWLSAWAKETKHLDEFSEWKQLRSNKISTYGFLGLIQGLFVCSGTYVVTRGSLAASTALYTQLLNNVLHLPLQYFETNPIGQIINRFTKDMFIIDSRFHYYLRTWLNGTLDVIGTVLVIVGALPLFILGVIPMVFFYFIIQRYYVASSRQIRRLSGASRSPVISHFSETLSGVSTIRAFGHEQRFIQQNKQVVNENLVCFYNNVISNRWLSVRLEFLGNFMVFFAALLAVLEGDSIDSAVVGLSISYALNLTHALNFWVKKTCEIETNAVSIERVCEYENMEKEAPWIMSRRPPLQWPKKGIVEFIHYQARYRDDLQLALKDITFQTEEEEKIGIVGRTGAGKSTLSNCLFRIVERSGGKIIIDGIDISTIGLHDLRGRLNIIPQDPVLFSGTLQMNLDPLDKYSDSELWEVLELCHLKDFVQSQPRKLRQEISEGGANLSVGQRQLVCLARALLRKTKILVLDEATASIDFETDNLVQTTIRKEFSDCTILTIAHRLHSVIDSDRVLVLDSGRIIEFESPQNLIHRKGSFFKMTTEAGITQTLETNIFAVC